MSQVKKTDILKLKNGKVILKGREGLTTPVEPVRQGGFERDGRYLYGNDALAEISRVGQSVALPNKAILGDVYNAIANGLIIHYNTNGNTAWAEDVNGNTVSWTKSKANPNRSELGKTFDATVENKRYRDAQGLYALLDVQFPKPIVEEETKPVEETTEATPVQQVVVDGMGDKSNLNFDDAPENGSGDGTVVVKGSGNGSGSGDRIWIIDANSRPQIQKGIAYLGDLPEFAGSPYENGFAIDGKLYTAEDAYTNPLLASSGVQDWFKAVREFNTSRDWDKFFNDIYTSKIWYLGKDSLSDNNTNPYGYGFNTEDNYWFDRDWENYFSGIDPYSKFYVTDLSNYVDLPDGYKAISYIGNNSTRREHTGVPLSTFVTMDPSGKTAEYTAENFYNKYKPKDVTSAYLGYLKTAPYTNGWANYSEEIPSIDGVGNNYVIVNKNNDLAIAVKENGQLNYKKNIPIPSGANRTLLQTILDMDIAIDNYAIKAITDSKQKGGLWDDMRKNASSFGLPNDPTKWNSKQFELFFRMYNRRGRGTYPRSTQIQVHKNGGMIRKMQIGGGHLEYQVIPTPPATIQDIIQDVSSTGITQDHVGWDNYSDAEKMQIYAALANVGGTGLSFINSPYTKIGGLVLSLGGTGTQFAADIKQDGFDRYDLLGLGANLGMDVASLVSKKAGVAKITKSIKELAPKLTSSLAFIAKAGIGTMMGMQATQSIGALSKVISGEELTSEDWTNLIYGLDLIATGGRLAGVAHNKGKQANALDARATGNALESTGTLLPRNADEIGDIVTRNGNDGTKIVDEIKRMLKDGNIELPKETKARLKDISEDGLTKLANEVAAEWGISIKEKNKFVFWGNKKYPASYTPPSSGNEFNHSLRSFLGFNKQYTPDMLKTVTKEEFEAAMKRIHAHQGTPADFDLANFAVDPNTRRYFSFANELASGEIRQGVTPYGVTPFSKYPGRVDTNGNYVLWDSAPAPRPAPTPKPTPTPKKTAYSSPEVTERIIPLETETRATTRMGVDSKYTPSPVQVEHGPYVGGPQWRIDGVPASPELQAQFDAAVKAGYDPRKWSGTAVPGTISIKKEGGVLKAQEGLKFRERVGLTGPILQFSNDNGATWNRVQGSKWNGSEWLDNEGKAIQGVTPLRNIHTNDYLKNIKNNYRRNIDGSLMYRDSEGNWGTADANSYVRDDSGNYMFDDASNIVISESQIKDWDPNEVAVGENVNKNYKVNLNKPNINDITDLWRVKRALTRQGELQKDVARTGYQNMKDPVRYAGPHILLGPNERNRIVAKQALNNYKNVSNDAGIEAAQNLALASKAYDIDQQYNQNESQIIAENAQAQLNITNKNAENETLNHNENRAQRISTTATIKNIKHATQVAKDNADNVLSQQLRQQDRDVDNQMRQLTYNRSQQDISNRENTSLNAFLQTSYPDLFEEWTKLPASQKGTSFSGWMQIYRPTEFTEVYRQNHKRYEQEYYNADIAYTQGMGSSVINPEQYSAFKNIYIPMGARRMFKSGGSVRSAQEQIAIDGARAGSRRLAEIQKSIDKMLLKLLK